MALPWDLIPLSMVMFKMYRVVQAVFPRILAAYCEKLPQAYVRRVLTRLTGDGRAV